MHDSQASLFKEVVNGPENGKMRIGVWNKTKKWVSKNWKKVLKACDVLFNCSKSKSMDQNGYQHQMDIQFGNTSKVTVAKTVTGDLVAIKSIPKSFVVQLYRQSATKLNLVKDEVTAMSTISSPWLVALYDVFQTHDQIHLVQEFCSQGDLFTYLMHREVLLFDLEYDLIVRQMVVCVQELHRHGFMHRDIKPMNFFLDSQGIKLGDFGSAIAVNPGQKLLDWSVGTDGFIAPEIENELPYGYEVDFYSLGVCIRDLFDFLNYLRSERDLDLYEKSYYLEELIEQLTEPDPKDRLCSFESIRLLPYFQQQMINWDKFVERKTEMLPSTFKSIAELAEQCIEDPDESIEFDGKLGKKYKRLFKGYRWGDYDV